MYTLINPDKTYIHGLTDREWIKDIRIIFQAERRKVCKNMPHTKIYKIYKHANKI